MVHFDAMTSEKVLLVATLGLKRGVPGDMV